MTPLPVVRQVNLDSEPRQVRSKPQRRETDTAKLIISTDIRQLNELKETVDAMLPSIHELTFAVERLEDKFTGRDQSLDLLIKQLTEGQRRLEDKVTQIWTMELERDLKINSALESVDKLLKSY